MLQNQNHHPSRLPSIPSLDGIPAGIRPCPALPEPILPDPPAGAGAGDHRLAGLLHIDRRPADSESERHTGSDTDTDADRLGASGPGGSGAADGNTASSRRRIHALPYRNRPPQLDPLGAAMFPLLRSIDSKYRLMLLYEASAAFSVQERAEAIALTGHVGALFSGTDVEPRMLRHYWQADGTLTSFASFLCELRHRPEFVAPFDAAVAEVRRLFEVLASLPGQAEHVDRVRSCYLRRYALVQLNRMSPDQRLRVASNGSGNRLAQALGITFLAESLFLSHTMGRLSRGESLPAFANDAQLAAGFSRLPAPQLAVWSHVAAVLEGALAGPLAAGKFRSGARLPTYAVPAGSIPEVECLDRRLADAARLPGNAEAQVVQNSNAVVLAEQPRFAALLKQLRRHSPGWSDVSDALGLSTAEFPDGTLGAYMTGSGLHRSLVREQARALLRARAASPEQAALDQAASRFLVQRLEGESARLDTSSMREKRLRRTATEDLVAAAGHLTPGQRAACLRYYGTRHFLQRLDLEVVGNIRRVINAQGHWHVSQKRRVAGLAADQSMSYVPRPGRVAILRASLADLLTLIEVMPVSPRDGPGPGSPTGEPGRPLSPDMDLDSDGDTEPSSPPMAVVKPEPDIQSALVQRYDSTIVALRPDGSDWLEGLDVSAARVCPQAWDDFERETGATARIGPMQRLSLLQRLWTEVRQMLQQPPDAEALAARFEFVTTLDEHERGRGVVTRGALPAFTLLFPYGGTVCADGPASDAYRERHPEAWRYAMCVNLPGEVVADGTAAPGATCYGYPAGSMATIVNTRTLQGSERQLRAAANVGALAVTVPGLPFAIPVLVTLQALPAGAELFLNYGVQFSRFVQSSLAGLPRWPTVKVEPGLRPPPTLQHFLSVYRGLPADGAQRLTQEPAVPPARHDWLAWIESQDCTLRPVPAGGDSWLQALEGHTLDAPRLQEARHDIADAMTRLPDTALSDATNARHVAQVLQGSPPDVRGVAAPYPRNVPHTVMADFLRIPGSPANASFVSAWCLLNDERLRSRLADGRRRPPATQVLVLADTGEATLYDAAGSRAILPAGLAGALAGSQVALLQNGGDHLEIVHRG